MTKEELEKATGQELIEQRDYCGVDGYYGDYLDDVNAEMLKRFNRLTDLEKENAEIKEQLEAAKQERNEIEKFKADYKELCNLKNMRIAELENEKCELLGIIQGKDEAIKNLTQNLEDTEIINKTLGERCNQLLADKGKLTDELDKWKDEWQEQVQKAIDEGYARTLQTIQLTKAKEHIRTLISCLIDWVQEGDKDYCYIAEAEQFLNSEVEK